MSDPTPPQGPTSNFTPMPNQPQPANSGQAFRAFMTRRVAMPMWAILVASCVVCAAVSAAASTGNGKSSTNTASIAPTATATRGPTATTGPTATPTKPPTPTHAPQWTTIQSFSGNGISNTAPFTVNDKQWKIKWSCDPAAYGSSYNLQADLTPPGQQFGDSVVNVICDQTQPTTLSGETMEYQTGTYYLAVNSEASWTFQIQVLK